MAIVNAIEVNTTTVSPFTNQAAFSVTQVNVPTAGTPVQAPTIVVPDGMSVSILADPSNANNAELFVATSSANALDPTKRIPLKRGQSVGLLVNNVNLVWLDASTNNQKAIIVVEG